MREFDRLGCLWLIGRNGAGSFPTVEHTDAASARIAAAVNVMMVRKTAMMMMVVVMVSSSHATMLR